MTLALAACAPWPVRPPPTKVAPAAMTPGAMPGNSSPLTVVPPPASLTTAVPGAVTTVPIAPAASASRAERIVDLAQQELGVPYHYGGATPRGFDCSGLVYYVFRRLGVTVPRTSNQQYAQLAAVNRADLSPGDLVFFRIAGEFQLHVGIFTGDGEFIHAPRPGRAVSYAHLSARYWKARYVGARRF